MTESFRSVWSTKRGRFLSVGVVGTIGILAVIGLTRGEVSESTTEPIIPVVQVTTANEYVGGESISLIGNVRAFSEAAITSERGGRVTSVRVNLGDTVSAGQIIATLENASEQAAVLQAEGVYEAALASAAQSDIGVDEADTTLTNAENAAVSAFKSAYNTNNSVVRNSIDSFFSNPDGQIPGLRIEGRGNTTFLNNERVAYQAILLEWQNRSQAITSQSDIDAELVYAKQVNGRTIAFVDTFLTVFSSQNGFSSRYTDAELQTFITNFSNIRSNLLATDTNLDVAITGLQSARDAVRRAEIAGTGSQTSASDAQVKQALGSLRAAQANLSKTILRTPISGTINSLDVRAGDFIGSFEEIALVANNSALEVVTYVGQGELEVLAVGDVVVIENSYEGRVTQIAPAVDSATRKTEVRIAVEDTNINNGDTVTISKEIEQAASETVVVPLTAVKFELTNSFMFFVEDGTLVSRPVELGSIRGGSVEIVSGLTQSEPFVVDARGLLEGTAVDVNQ